MARAKQIKERRAKAKSEAASGDRVVATNRRARYDYEILETLECGIMLTGSEVKSLREGTAQITEAYARIDDGELWLFQMHIPPWAFAVGFGTSRTVGPRSNWPSREARNSKTVAKRSPSATRNAKWPVPCVTPRSSPDRIAPMSGTLVLRLSES
jgi:SsrA-binding protein